MMGPSEHKIHMLKLALHFYADPKHYAQRGWQGDPIPSEVATDAGELAREALKATGEAK